MEGDQLQSFQSFLSFNFIELLTKIYVKISLLKIKEDGKFFFVYFWKNLFPEKFIHSLSFYFCLSHMHWEYLPFISH